MDNLGNCGNLKALRERIYYYTEILKAHARQKGRCLLCGEGPLEKFVTHHVKPRRLGGGDNAENLEILCSHKCHGLRERQTSKSP